MISTPTLAIDAATQKKMYGSSMNKLIVLNKEMKYTMYIVKYLKELGLLNKGVSEKSQK